MDLCARRLRRLLVSAAPRAHGAAPDGQERDDRQARRARARLAAEGHAPGAAPCVAALPARGRLRRAVDTRWVAPPRPSLRGRGTGPLLCRQRDGQIRDQLPDPNTRAIRGLLPAAATLASRRLGRLRRARRHEFRALDDHRSARNKTHVASESERDLLGFRVVGQVKDPRGHRGRRPRRARRFRRQARARDRLRRRSPDLALCRPGGGGPRHRYRGGVDHGKRARALPDRLRDRVEFRVADAQALDVPRQRFDIAFLSWSL